jgi:hypothetical protein
MGTQWVPVKFEKFYTLTWLSNREYFEEVSRYWADNTGQ